MGSGLSKVYSVLIDGFPIYDSRVACALACLVSLYCQEQGVKAKPGSLNLKIPSGQSNKSNYFKRCKKPATHSNPQVHAEANLKAVWLLQEMVRDPGRFGEVEGANPVIALQNALFMVGYTKIPDNAISTA